jgi:DNA-directed RNA polymerase specialized sigma24 family protein
MTRLTFPVLDAASHTFGTDAELLAALRAGDASAVSPFLKRYWRTAWLIAVRYAPGGNAKTLAWDALTDLALDLLNGRHRAPRVASPRAYIWTTIRHHALSVLKSEHRFGRHLAALETMEKADIGQAMSQATYRAAHGGSFDTSENVPRVPLPVFLTPAEIQLMTWVSDEWTQQQIADELHIERETVKKRIQRLRHRAQQRHAAQIMS